MIGRHVGFFFTFVGFADPLHYSLTLDVFYVFRCIEVQGHISEDLLD